MNMKPIEITLWSSERSPKDEGIAPTKSNWKYLQGWAKRAAGNSYPKSFPGYDPTKNR